MTESELVLSLLGIATKYLESGATFEQVHPIINLIYEQTKPKAISSITITKDGKARIDTTKPHTVTVDPTLKEPMPFTYKEYMQPLIPNIDKSSIPECCRGCSNHPTNGGSGVCVCALPYLSKTMNAPETLWNVAPTKRNGITVATSETISYNTNKIDEVKI